MDAGNEKGKSDINIRPDSSMKNIVEQEINAPAMLNSHTNSPHMLKEKKVQIDNEMTEEIQ